MKVSVIIPMYNESAVIENTAKALCSYMDSHFDSYEIVFCNDGSTDESRNILERLELPCVRVVGYEQNKGKGSAVRLGMSEASGDIKLFTDADLAYGTDVIGRAYDIFANDERAEVLVGSRNAEKDGYTQYTFMRRLMSKTYIRLVRLLGGVDCSDCQCGFKAFRASAADAIFSECTTDGFSFDLEVMLRAKQKGMKVVEMPVILVNHTRSSVKPMKDTLCMISDIVKIKRAVGKTK
jgi:dolichyl-phosphate beta-glucosyltransferase